MKFGRAIAIGLFFASPAFILGASSIPPAALGQVEARISFCVKVDSSYAEAYKELGKRLVANMTEKELKEARESSDYKQNYDSTTSELEKVPADKAVQTCRAAVSSGQ